jgi:hypothetical protein
MCVYRLKRARPHGGWTGYDGVSVTVSGVARSMSLKVLNLISGMPTRLEFGQEPATSM